MGSAAAAEPTTLELPPAADDSAAPGDAARADLAPVDAAGVDAAPGADDLLSKLAGDEIDRMLAEAEGTAPAAGSGAPAIDAAAPATDPRAASTGATAALASESPAPDDAAAALDGVSVSPPAGAGALAMPSAPEPAAQPAPSAVAAPVVSAQPPAAPGATSEKPAPAAAQAVKLPEQPSSADAAMQAEIDNLFAELTGQGATPAEMPAPVSERIDGPSAPAAEASSASPADSLDAELVRSLEAPPASASPAITPARQASPRPETDDLHEPAGTPWLLKPLEWLNAPLASLSPGLRETIGKIAIVTAFNAVVVLAYVFFFRP